MARERISEGQKEAKYVRVSKRIIRNLGDKEYWGCIKGWQHTATTLLPIAAKPLN